MPIVVYREIPRRLRFYFTRAESVESEILLGDRGPAALKVRRLSGR